VQIRQATIMNGDTFAHMTSRATIGLPVAEDVSLRARRDRGGHPRSKLLTSVFTTPLFPLTAKLKTEKA
jgi:hypothetical protein